ncbi:MULTISPECIES: MurR/RpiR family transcriptional regulator [Microbacterium]|uniref:MurR/RpiR family transcriptional regulator n=1 Tax=Microbacterium sufflavum TaxID=2851649 RepID=A0ABY4IJK9_9MICO|nr:MULTISPECIES: MurR/RpiR family transcriptional regulator [Microbacterium]MBN6190425.1 MurR/RpiR family transcriptional regulator [Aneurinibacillus sp. BA2021]MCK2026711.1 MurR/RpiR family transcriptional regulator [Microbacterium sufflavum]UPL11488.1 MurR/RpiR family transcriptional regulator [Microbacterium sufflavum]
MSIQSTIEAAASTLPPSLARIATVVRENPSIVIDKTINELAEECQTSVASVVRFCRAIGFSGYAPLRMALATELGKEAAQFSARGAFGSEISDEDTLQEAVSKLAALELLAIEETVAQLDFDVLEAAIDAIDGADRILLYGIGASQFVAEDLAHKLLRVGRNAHVLADPHEAVAATVLHAAPTVAIGFSHAGSTIETVRFLETARANGAATVAVTSAKDSPLAHAADHALFTEVRESAFRAGAMVSRIAQLTLVDCLFIGVAKRRYAETVDALRRTRQATHALRD